MGRPIYQYELSDADFSWLLNSFQEANPQYVLVESSCLPVVLIKISDRGAVFEYEDEGLDTAESEEDITSKVR